jgi:heme oxygenase
MDIASEALAIASIRRATVHRHTTLEAVLQLTPSLSLRRYLSALRGFELFLSVWEPRIELALPPGLRRWFASRSRRGLLRQDLDRLDHGRVARDEIRRGCEQAVSEIDLSSVAATFGSLYVLEGSALGGQVIARVARATLGLNPDNGAAYFNGIDRHTAASWRGFQSLLEDQVGVEPIARLQACAAARQTFDALIITFTSLCRDHAAA